MSMCEERRVVASFFHGKNHDDDDASTPHSADFYNKYDPHFLENAGGAPRAYCKKLMLLFLCSSAIISDSIP